MNELSKALESLEVTLKERVWDIGSSPTPPLGSISAGGNLTTANRAPTSTASLPNPHPSNPHGSQKASVSLPSTELRLSASDKERLTITLARVCALQGQYGKTAAELETLVEGYCWVLGGYPIQSIIEAIGKFIRTSRDIPKPADIEAVINPPPPRIDWPLYIELKKRLREGNVYVDRDEKQFVRNCEDLAIIRQRGEMASYNDAQRQLETHQRQLLTYGDE